MKKKLMFLPGNALIWIIVIIASSNAHQSTEIYDKIQPILLGGAMVSLVLFGLGLNKLPKE